MNKKVFFLKVFIFIIIFSIGAVACVYAMRIFQHKDVKSFSDLISNTKARMKMSKNSMSLSYATDASGDVDSNEGDEGYDENYNDGDKDGFNSTLNFKQTISTDATEREDYKNNSNDKNSDENDGLDVCKNKRCNIEIRQNKNKVTVIVDGVEEKDPIKARKIIDLYEKKSKEMENKVTKDVSNLLKDTIANDLQSDMQTMQQNITNSAKSELVKEEIKQNMSSDSYNTLVKNLTQSVVHVKGIYLTDVREQQRYDLLNAFAGEVFPPRKFKTQGSGSGFFISQDGYIVTNHHVIDEAQSIDVETQNGNKYKAKVVGYYEGADLAVLKINPINGEKFKPVKFGNSDTLSIGDHVIIIGGPLGYKWSASAGIISGKSRDVNYNQGDNEGKHAWGTVGEFIQVDAAINGGNSGGPAFNMNGEMVGVSTCGYVGLQGMNFIIAANSVKEVLPQLRQGKTIARGFWGVKVSELEPWDLKAIGLTSNSGMMINEVTEKSPADLVGIKRGDVIIKVNGKDVKDAISMRDINGTIMAGSVSDIVINRYGKIMKFKVGTINLRELEKLEKGEIGQQEFFTKTASYRLLTSKMHRNYKLPKFVKGVIVANVKNDNNPMFMLAVGDIIMQVNDMPINSIEDYKVAINKLKKEKKTMAIFHVYQPVLGIAKVKGSRFE